MATCFRIDLTEASYPPLGVGVGVVDRGVERFVLWARTSLNTNSSGDVGVFGWRVPSGELWIPVQGLLFTNASGTNLSQWALIKKCAVVDTARARAQVYRPYMDGIALPSNAVVDNVVQGTEYIGTGWWSGVPSLEATSGDITVGLSAGGAMPISIAFPQCGAASSSNSRPFVMAPNQTYALRVTLSTGWSVGDFFSFTLSGYRVALRSRYGKMFVPWLGGI